MPNLRTAHQLFLDSSRIQIQTELTIITVTGLHNFVSSPPFSLSLIYYSRIFSLSLSFSLRHYKGGLPFKTKKIPIARTYSIHSSSKKTSSKTHSKKNLKSKPIKLNQQEHNKTKKKKKDPLKKKLKPTAL